MKKRNTLVGILLLLFNGCYGPLVNNYCCFKEIGKMLKFILLSRLCTKLEKPALSVPDIREACITSVNDRCEVLLSFLVITGLWGMTSSVKYALSVSMKLVMHASAPELSHNSVNIRKKFNLFLGMSFQARRKC
jgi:hypothetical protein